MIVDFSIRPVRQTSPEQAVTDGTETVPCAQPNGRPTWMGASVEAIRQALRAAGYPALRDLQIEIERGVVVLWGRTPTYHQKQLAQAIAQQVDGVRGIANGIEVVCCR